MNSKKMIESTFIDEIRINDLKKNDNNEGFEYAVQLTRLVSTPCGIWPSKFSSRISRLLRPFLIVTCLLGMLFLLIPACLFMFLIVRDMRVRIKLLGPLGFSLMSLFKYSVVLIKNNEIEKCIQSMLDDWQHLTNIEDRYIMFKNARAGRVLTIVCMILMYGGGMLHVTVVPLAKGSTTVGNITFRALAYPGYFIFFNPYIRPVYDVVFLTQCLCGFTRYTITIGVYSVVIICIMHICSRIAITSNMLQNLSDNYDDKLVKTIVQHHLKFLNFVVKLDKIFNEIFLVEVMGSTACICLTGYYFITEYEQREGVATMGYFVALTSFVSNIFILCYIGEILTEKCESISNTAYTTKWYQLSGKEARSIVFIVACNQRPVVLRAGILMQLSLTSFSQIIKTSAGYLNILRTAIVSAS